MVDFFFSLLTSKQLFSTTQLEVSTEFHNHFIEDLGHFFMAFDLDVTAGKCYYLIEYSVSMYWIGKKNILSNNELNNNSTG